WAIFVNRARSSCSDMRCACRLLAVMLACGFGGRALRRILRQLGDTVPPVTRHASLRAHNGQINNLTWRSDKFVTAKRAFAAQPRWQPTGNHDLNPILRTELTEWSSNGST